MNVYIRDADSNTYDAPLATGLENFLSEGGYRISLYLPGVEIIIRRDNDVPVEKNTLGEEVVCNCSVTIRR